MHLQRIRDTHTKLMVKKDKELPPRPDNPIWNDDFCRGCGVEFNPINPGATRHYHSKDCKKLHAINIIERPTKTKDIPEIKFELLIEDKKRILKLIKTNKLTWLTKEVSDCIETCNLTSIRWLSMLMEVGIFERSVEQRNGGRVAYHWKLTNHPEIFKLYKRIKK